MSSVRTRARTPGKAFQRMGFRPAKGRELSPMPGLTLDVFVLALPPETQRGPDGPPEPLAALRAMIRAVSEARVEQPSSRPTWRSGGRRRRPRSQAAGAVVAAAYAADRFASAEYREQLTHAQDRADKAELLVAVDRRRAVLGSVTYSLAGQPYAEVSRPGEAEFRMLGRRTRGPRPRGRGRAGPGLPGAGPARPAPGRGALHHAGDDGGAGDLRRLGFVRDPERDWQPIPYDPAARVRCLFAGLVAGPADPGGAIHRAQARAP